MKRTQRDQTIALLRDIWTRREIGDISDSELRHFTDDTIAHLYRFWSHKDRFWAEEDDDLAIAASPAFTEAPPMGWDKFQAARPKLQVVLNDSPNFGKQFKTAAGGHLTGRQFAKQRALRN